MNDVREIDVAAEGRLFVDGDANVDYLENIAQIQRAWDKELETRRDELMANARAIEEIEVAPTARNIEITRYLILWATSLP